MSYNFKVGFGNVSGKPLAIFMEGSLESFSDFCKDILSRHICSKGYFTAYVIPIRKFNQTIPAVAFDIDSEIVLMKLAEDDFYTSVFDLSEFPEKERLTEEHETILGIK